MLQKLFLLWVLVITLSSCNFFWEWGWNKIIENKIILTLGDSLTAGYGVEKSEGYPSKLEKKFIADGYDVTIINGGISWDTSWGLLKRAWEYFDQNPDIVIIVIWWNDGLKGRSVADIQKNIEDIISLFQSQNIEVILGWMDILPIHGFGYRSDFIKIYKDVAQQNDEIYFLKSFLSWVGGRAKLNQQDNIHPNADGYDVIVSNMYDFLLKSKLVEK